MKKIYLTKSTGEVAPFSVKKLRRSLQRAGAHPELVNDIVFEIQKGLYEGITTGEIYAKAFELLGESSAHLAARYKLKKAIMELGPSGYPFERYIGELLRNRQFDIELGKIVEGRCVTHEIDVTALRGDEKILIECKYHNRSGFLCDVKVSLYVHARFQDVAAGLESRGENSRFDGWLVTNTRFSDDAARYGACAGMYLLGWNYPFQNGLKEMIDQERLYPLTCLTTLTEREKSRLLEQNIVLCSDLLRRDDLLTKIPVAQERIQGVLNECRSLCNTRKKQ